MEWAQSQGWLSSFSRTRHGDSTGTAQSNPLSKGPGLHKIWEADDAKVDLVFVHGLTGSAKTWYDLKSKTCWPLDLLPKDIPFARIFIWEYDADIFSIWVSHHVSQNNLAAHGSNLCDRLANHRCRTATQHRPLVFIGHSLGGLVIQKTLLHSDESSDVRYHDIVDSTAGVIFLGTPHRGSTFANWGSLCTDLAHGVKDVNQAIVKLLMPESEVLFQLRDSFVKLVMRRAKENTHALKVHCYFEELGMTLTGKIVTTDSAILDGYPYSSIHADHRNMTKFGFNNGRLDQAYIDVMECIWMMTEHAKTLKIPVALPVGTSIAKNLRKRPLSFEQNSPTGVEVADSFQLFPRNKETIHLAATATALWDVGKAEPSHNFASKRLKRAMTKPPLTSEFANSERNLQRINSLDDKVRQIVEKQESLSSHVNHSEGNTTERIMVVAKWLSMIDHRKMHDFHGSKRYKETGIWLSDTSEFRSWRDTSRSNIFWLHGSPGAGKTLLSSFVVDALSANSDVTVLYFYCSYQRFGGHVQVLRSLLKQLYLQTTSKNTVETFFLSHGKDIVCDGNETELRAYFDLFLQSLSTPRTYIVIDGADECTYDGLENLFTAWNYVSKRSRKIVKLFISSRKTSDIESAINRKLQIYPGGTQLSLDLSHGQTTDIDRFIDGRIEEVSKQWEIWQNSGANLFSAAKSMLMQRSNGSFLWVRTAIDQWYTSASTSTSDQDFGVQLPQAVPSLTHLYDTYMQFIATENPVIASIAEKTFYWITFALEPLGAKNIAFAITLGLSEKDMKAVKPIDGPKLAEFCNGLVCFQEPDQLLPQHPTVMEFLSQHLDSDLGHLYLAKICLKSLTTMAVKRDSASVLEEDRTGAEGLLAYARKNYMMHGFKCRNARSGKTLHCLSS